jgi:DNA polymerase-3 subunit epsilon
MYLIFDTETTGFPTIGLHKSDPKQARICQLAFVLLDERFNCLESFKTYIKPDGWKPSTYNEEHGTTLEKCIKEGILIEEAMLILEHMIHHNASRVIAYNIEFDSKLVEIESNVNQDWKHKQICAMHPMTNVCRIPSKRGGFKWPKLIEAYEHLFGKKFDGAHDALNDVIATVRIFRYLVENKLVQV